MVDLSKSEIETIIEVLDELVCDLESELYQNHYSIRLKQIIEKLKKELKGVEK